MNEKNAEKYNSFEKLTGQSLIRQNASDRLFKNVVLLFSTVRAEKCVEKSNHVYLYVGEYNTRVFV